MDYNTICGTTGPLTVSPNQAIIVTEGQNLAWSTDADRYVIFTQAVMESWFTFTASPSGCRPYAYQLIDVNGYAAYADS